MHHKNCMLTAPAVHHSSCTKLLCSSHSVLHIIYYRNMRKLLIIYYRNRRVLHVIYYRNRRVPHVIYYRNRRVLHVIYYHNRRVLHVIYYSYREAWQLIEICKLSNASGQLLTLEYVMSSVELDWFNLKCLYCATFD